MSTAGPGAVVGAGEDGGVPVPGVAEGVRGGVPPVPVPVLA
ncbi:hypothetical protein [Streptomyces sp. NPDC018711]